MGDIDFRGISLNLPSDLLGLTEFDQYIDNHFPKELSDAIEEMLVIKEKSNEKIEIREYL